MQGRRTIAVVAPPLVRPVFCEPRSMDETLKTGEAWRDEWCPTCRGNRQHRMDSHGTWRCVYCHTAADPHTARRLDGAESNRRKQEGVTVKK